MSNVKKKKKRMKTWKKLLLFFIEIVFLAAVIVLWYVVDKFSKLDVIEIDRDAIVINQEIYEKNTALKKYTNILLLGTDSRTNSADAMNEIGENHTDAIIIASINNETKEVKLVSVYRDTLLLVPGGTSDYNDTYRKATEAAFFSGIESTIGMVNMNLDLDIQDYVMVNFEALIRIIDAMGGIDLEINENELYWINEYMRETGEVTGRTYELVPNAGYVHLDGIQATAYCRNRFDSNLDYGRAERQRKVIGLLFEKAQKMNIVQLNEAINSVLDNVSTSFSAGEILEMAQYVFEYSLVGQEGFPYEKFGSVKKIKELGIVDPVVPVNLAANVTELHEFLFGVENYDPTSRIHEISDYLDKLLEINKSDPDNVY